MFENTKDFKRVIVSGPQRSGTRIVSKAICYDTNKEYIDEQDIAFFDIRLLQWYLMKENVVIQCPAICHKLHEIAVESTLVVIVKRPINDIVNSEIRVGWPEVSRQTELAKYGYSAGIISKIKYDYWDNYQKSRMQMAFTEFKYNDIVGHPLYIAERRHFNWEQTTNEDADSSLISV